MRKLKIAIYTPTFPPKGGGIATSHFNIYNLLKGEFVVKAFVFKETINEKNEEYIKCKDSKLFSNILMVFLNLFLKRYSKIEEFIFTRGIFSCFYTIKKLNKHLQNFNPDIIIVPDHYVPLYWLKKPSNSKIIWYSHQNYNRFRNNPFLYPNSANDTDIAKSMERKALLKASAIICPSNYMVNECQKAYNTDLPISIIHNFIESNSFSTIQLNNVFFKYKSVENIPIVYIPSAGTLTKGIRYTFEIVRRLSKILDDKIGFYLSGHIPVDLKFELNLLTNKKIHMPGELNWHENIAIIKNASICISPTLAENYSASIVEVLTLGIPVITFEVGGNSEIVEDSETGFIVPFLDIELLIEKSKLLLMDFNLHNQMSIKAKNKALMLLDQKEILNQYISLFNNLISSK